MHSIVFVVNALSRPWRMLCPISRPETPALNREPVFANGMATLFFIFPVMQW